MARINVEQAVFTDSRFDMLASLLGCSRHEVLGRMILIWNECQEREVFSLEPESIAILLGNIDGATQLVRSRLGRVQKNERVYIAGAKSRLGWLKEKRRKARSNGKLGGRPKKTDKEPTLVRDRLTIETPPAPAPALESSSPSETQTLMSIGSSLRSEPHPPAGGKRGRPAYTEGFLAAWKAYPHYGQRSKKAEAFKVWRKLHLEDEAEAVLRWIIAGKGGEEWQKDHGSFVPGMQVWLKGHDFSDAPEIDPDCARCGDKGELNAEGVCDWCVGMDKARAARKAEEARA